MGQDFLQNQDTQHCQNGKIFRTDPDPQKGEPQQYGQHSGGPGRECSQQQHQNDPYSSNVYDRVIEKKGPVTQKAEGQEQRQRLRKKSSREHPEQENDCIKDQQSVSQVKQQRMSRREHPMVNSITDHEQRRPLSIRPNAGRRKQMSTIEVISAVSQRKVEMQALDTSDDAEGRGQEQETDQPGHGLHYEMSPPSTSLSA